MYTDLGNRLRYRGAGKAILLPDWASYLIRLGESVGARAETAKSVMVVASVPVRAFAAVLTSMGIVVRRALDPEHRVGLEEHFRRVSSRGVGTAVTVTRGKRRFAGVLQGTVGRGDSRYLRVQLAGAGGGNETLSVSIRHCHRVQLRSEPYELTDRRSSERASGPAPFLVDCLDMLSATRLVQRARTDCVLRGHLSLIEPELRTQHFEVETDQVGTLSQILRPKRFIPKGAPHRSTVLTLRQSLPVIDAPEPPVLVFDGALSFLRHSKHIAAHNSIVLLDRSETRYDDALDGVLDILRTRGSRRNSPDSLGVPPRGLDLLFVEM